MQTSSSSTRKFEEFLSGQEPRGQEVGRYAHEGPPGFKRNRPGAKEHERARVEQQRGSASNFNALSSSDNPRTGSPGSLIKSFSQLVQEHGSNQPKEDESLLVDPKSFQN